MKHTNSNEFFLLLVVLLHGPLPSSTQSEFNVEIPTECQNFCDSKRPKRTHGPYLLKCYDSDCSDTSCETHKCPSEICKNGRQIFCPSTKGLYHSSRKIKAPVEAAPMDTGVDTFYLVFWAFAAFVIIGICCALVSWNSSRKKAPEGYMTAGYIHGHQGSYHRKRVPEKGGGCSCCCVGGNEDVYQPKRHSAMERDLSIVYMEEDEEETYEKPYSLDKVKSEQSIAGAVSDHEIERKAITTESTTEIREEAPAVSSISIIKAPPVQVSMTNMPSMSAMSIKLAESASSIEYGMEIKEKIVIDTRPSST